MKLCRSCGILTDNFSHSSRTVSNRGMKTYWHKTCTDCRVRHNRTVKELYKIHTPPAAGTPCECCNRVRPTHLDHDHTTGAFRGWICRECNTGLGLLSDSVAGVTAALLYLTA